MVKAITRDQFVSLWEAGIRCVSVSGVYQERTDGYARSGEHGYASEADFNAVVNRHRESVGWFFAVAAE